MESDDVGETSQGEPVDGGVAVATRHEAACAAVDERVGVLAAQLHAVSAELVDAVAEFDALGGAQGFRSVSQWLSVRAGFTPGEAQRLASLAARLDQLPTLMEHARAGQLSAGVVAMAARVTTADNEARVAELALSCTPAQASRVLSRYRTLAPDPAQAEPGGSTEPGDAADTPTPEAPTWWRSWSDEAGRGRIDAALSPDVAALVQQAWEAARAAGEADRPVTPATDPSQAQLDSWSRLGANEIASRWAMTMLDHAHDEGLRAPGGEHFGVQVHLDVATLARVLGLDVDPSLPVGLGTQAFDARTGAHLADHEVARFLCGAGIQVLVHHQGVPLWCSNEHRSANRHQRRALRARSGGGCEYPGCTQTRHLELHHVIFHSHGGPTDLANLTSPSYDPTIRAGGAVKDRRRRSRPEGLGALTAPVTVHDTLEPEAGPRPLATRCVTVDRRPPTLRRGTGRPGSGAHLARRSTVPRGTSPDLRGTLPPRCRERCRCPSGPSPTARSTPRRNQTSK